MTFFKRHRLAIVVVATCAAIAAGIALFSSKPAAPQPPQPAAAPKPVLTITTTQPTQTSLPIKLGANGSIAAWQEAIIGSEAGGLRLTEVRANVGDRVTKGQVLAVFALESVQAELAQTRASVTEAEATALEANANADKARTLQASGALSEQQINQYLTAAKTAAARLEAARATLKVQQVRLAQTQLLAPDNGIVSARAATVGAVVGAGTELFRMIRGGRLEWRAEVTSSELGRIAPGTAVTLLAANGAQVTGKTRTIAPTVDPQTRNALVYVDLPPMLGATRGGMGAATSRGTGSAGPQAIAPSGGSEPRAAGSVGAATSRGTGSAGPQATTPSGGSEPRAAGSVGAATSRGTGSAGPQATAPSGGSEPRAAGSVGATTSRETGSAGPQATTPSGGSAVREATNVGATFLPGMFARGEFELGATPALTVPQRAIVVRDGFTHVFTVGEGDRVTQVKVQTGRQAGDQVEITAGLNADARVAVEGAGFLNDGNTVRINDKNEPNKPLAQAGSRPVATN